MDDTEYSVKYGLCGIIGDTEYSVKIRSGIIGDTESGTNAISGFYASK